MRLGDNLRLVTNIDPSALEYKTPQLLLQPLIENAVIHGVAGNENGGDINIRIKNKDESIYISIVNSRLNQSAESDRETSGLGLLAVKASLESVFGTNATLQTEIIDNSFQVNIIMPAEDLRI